MAVLRQTIKTMKMWCELQYKVTRFMLLTDTICLRSASAVLTTVNSAKMSIFLGCN